MAPVIDVLLKTNQQKSIQDVGQELMRKQQKSLDQNKQAAESISFETLLDKIRIAFSRPDKRVDVDDLWRILESYKSDPKDWQKYAFYETTRYKRNFVDGEDNYNVMVLCWSEGAKSCIHDHSGSHCFMKILDGELIENRFAWPEQDIMIEKTGPNCGQEMRLLKEARVGKNEVLYINDKVGLHQVLNPNGNKTAASLHVYIPPIRICRAFDQRTGQSQECKLTFYSKRGKITYDDDGDHDDEIENDISCKCEDLES